MAYVDTGHAWVAAGAPVAPLLRLHEVATLFVEAARAAGRRASFFAAESRLAKATGLEAVLIGEQPVWDPARWEQILRESRSLREQLRRARAKGVAVREATPEEVTQAAPIRQAMEALVSQWLASRSMAPMGFLVDVEPFSFAAERRYLLAHRGERLVGFLVAVPIYARQGWLFEDLLRAPDAPNGTTELLVDGGLRLAAREGSRHVTLGLAPLAGPVRGWLRLVRESLSAFYDFGGVHAFKAKLRPDEWAPVYLVYPPGLSAAVAFYDTLSAFARGSFTRFSLQTMLRGPSVVVHVLAGLLVPWTLALALVDPVPWFPSRGVQLAWVGFDVALSGALFRLAARWRRALGIAIASAVTLDAVLTTLQALVFNLPRIRGLGQALVVAVACLAPILAAWILWGAVRTRSAVQLHGGSGSPGG